MGYNTKNQEVEDLMQGGLRLDLNRPWARVLHLAKKYEYPKRTRVRFSLEMDRDFYYISKGQVCLQVSSADGKERMTNYFGEGSIFNLATVFFEGFEDFGAWVFLEDSITWRFPGKFLHDEKFVSEYPDLIINIMRSLSFSMLTHSTWITEMYLSRPITRVARYLVGLSVAEGSNNCFVGATQQDAAQQLGMHRGTLSAALKELKEKGIISEFSRGHLHILDIERLRQISMF